MSKLRVAVVGVGHLGQHHARIAASAPDAVLAAVVDPDPVRGPEIAAKFGAPWVATLAEVLAEVDAVQIAAPTGFHHALGTQALKAGKHVLMEKPLAATLDEGVALLQRHFGHQFFRAAKHHAVHPALAHAAGLAKLSAHAGQVEQLDDGVLQHMAAPRAFLKAV